MTPGLAKMWLSFVAMGMMIAAALIIMWARAKLKGFFRFLFSLLAYACLIFAAGLMLLVVLSGPG
ncbi:DUF2768 domain-containing protein [Caenibacillus caldisaponilyticus]|jgi:hypothetical protein|uniref:DUF2768 domain-containing protein n=1 Tax=Caenibacillus caldisaponilyticus TaxID=1674942 RepID=UPI0009885859|nr:DUF2768 domain-containing protein [Caenibacillus caldisaponilyticus]